MASAAHLVYTLYTSKTQYKDGCEPPKSVITCQTHRQVPTMLLPHTIGATLSSMRGAREARQVGLTVSALLDYFSDNYDKRDGIHSFHTESLTPLRNLLRRPPANVSILQSFTSPPPLLDPRRQAPKPQSLTSQGCAFPNRQRPAFRTPQEGGVDSVLPQVDTTNTS